MPLHPAWFTSTRFGPYFAEDLDRIPNLPPHTELIDGNLIFRSSEDLFYFLAVDAIGYAVERAAPSHLFRPDSHDLAVDEVALGGIGQTGFELSGSLVVVEAISREQTSRDRRERLDLYAAAGIPHFWLARETDGKTVVEVWSLNQELDSYDLAGEFTDRLELEEPFPVALDLWEIDERRR